MMHSYGWIPGLADQRDVPFENKLIKLPSKVSMRSGMPPVYDQGQLGSCTANALSAQLDFMRNKQGEKFIHPSRLFIYYNERVMEGTTTSDAGAMGRHGIKSLQKQGVCPESEWPYIVSTFTAKPSIRCYEDAIKFEALTYKRVSRVIEDIKAALLQELPISFGFTVYESFESDAVAKTGVMPMPKPDEAVLGGHETLIVGFDDSKHAVEVRNSWGSSWGDKGYFWMPYQYLVSKLCSDFWVIDKVK